MAFSKKEQGFLSFGAALIILMVSMSFGIYMIEPCNSGLFVYVITGSNSVDCDTLGGGLTGQNGAIADVNSQLSDIFGALGILGGGAIIAFSAAFPNGYGIFAAVAYFLLGALTMPINLFNSSSGLPNEVRLFFIAIFSLLNIFAVLSYLGAKNY